jgi:2'-5' RNA ligase
MNMDIERLNIVILPPENITTQMTQISQSFTAAYDALLTVGHEGTFPHISLYQTWYPAGSHEVIIHVLSAVLQRIKAPKITLNSYSNFQQWLFWDAIKTPELIALHSSILEVLNPLRQNVRGDNDLAILNDPTLAEQYKQNVRDYGYLLAYDLFQPHVTVSVIEPVAKATEAAAQTPPNKVTFTGAKIALTNVDAYGTVTKIYHTWQLDE